MKVGLALLNQAGNFKLGDQGRRGAQMGIFISAFFLLL